MKLAMLSSKPALVRLVCRRLQVRVVDVDARVALRIDVQLAAVDGQVGRPAQVDCAAAVVLVGVEDAVAVAVVAEEQLRRDALDEEQLLDAVERAVLGVVGRV